MTGRCNICGWSDRFLRLERGREGTVCRNCGSSSRNRAVAWVLGRVLDEDQAVFRWKYRTSAPMLESSARGALAMYFRKKFDYYGTEYDPKKIAAGNQPRMKLETSADPNVLSFQFTGGSNMKETDQHMHSAQITFVDADHIKGSWSSVKEGKNTGNASFDLVRKK